jgi:hypothetical protein
MHPDAAMLGDTEWLKYQQAQLAAKDTPHVPQLPPVLDPNSTLPIIDHESGR